jgi:serine/threonine protein kinase/Flp pilus assembly protein TadD
MAEQIDDNQEKFIKDAVQQFVDAQIDGQEPDLDEFVSKYPEFEHQIRRRISNVRKIDLLFASLTQAEESDFEDEDTAIRDDLVGQKIASFEIVEMIGRGGMGVVYLAHDTKLDRSVAIKSMPAKLTDDSTARMRFKREAKSLASLNHPNIAAIHDIIEPDEGAGFLVLEYIPGETLAERIAREPLELEQTLSISRQIAEAVATAHEKGVIHRDIKPSNIKITPDGRVKVLDFGLAKPSVGEGRNSETNVTQAGRVIGTPAYMSPEQARGQATDKRSDIWSFGCVLYEMLTATVLFKGETVSDTLANILQIEPDWQALPQDTPANIQVLLRRCLEKDPHRRLRDIGDAAIEISDTLRSVTMPTSVSFESAITPKLKLRKMAMIIGAAIIIVLTAIVVWFIPKEQTLPASREIRLVVLPFENLGPAEDEYFADGITDAITARLAGISGLGVISRQSAMQYKDREKNAQQIGKELRVNYILEGTVQRERPSDPTSSVRIIPQLIRTSDDTHVWAEIYDNDMSEVFRVQSDLAEQVAQALDITLLEPERRALASRPTENIEAYDYYLRGNEYSHRDLFHESDLRVAIRMYDKAVELDTRFALAYAQLSRAHLFMYFLFYDHIEERLAMAKDALDKALELAPDLLEVRLALGHYYYHGHLDYDLALEQFAIARKRQPNNSELLTLIGYVQRRQGKFEKAVETLKEASELAPRYARLAYHLGETFMLLRKYSEAERYYERAISLAPDLPRSYAWKAKLYLLWEGKTEKARAALGEAPQNIGSLEDGLIVLRSVLLDVFDENYQEALAQLSSGTLEAFGTQFYFIPKAQLYAQIYGLMGDRQLEQAHYESARNILETKAQEQPEDSRLHSALGIAYAGLGRKEDAIREGKRGMELLPVSKEAWRGPHRVEALAKIYVMVGEFDEAVEKLEFLLSRPGEISIPLLRLDPTWKPLHKYQRFIELLESGNPKK